MVSMLPTLSGAPREIFLLLDIYRLPRHASILWRRFTHRTSQQKPPRGGVFSLLSFSCFLVGPQVRNTGGRASPIITYWLIVFLLLACRGHRYSQETDRQTVSNARLTIQDLYETYMPAFKACILAEPQQIMWLVRQYTGGKCGRGAALRLSDT